MDREAGTAYCGCRRQPVPLTARHVSVTGQRAAARTPCPLAEQDPRR